jgi:hypothetical protein
MFFETDTEFIYTLAATLRWHWALGCLVLALLSHVTAERESTVWLWECFQ